MASTHINNTGARAGWKGFVGLLVGAVIGFAFMPGIAQAESFSKLEKQGYAVGKLTKGKAGGSVLLPAECQPGLCQQKGDGGHHIVRTAHQDGPCHVRGNDRRP